jgi:hypothetical protein
VQLALAALRAPVARWTQPPQALEVLREQTAWQQPAAAQRARPLSLSRVPAQRRAPPLLLLVLAAEQQSAPVAEQAAPTAPAQRARR